MPAITATTDHRHIGTQIEMPKPGDVLRLGDSEFRVIAVQGHTIVCFNYIVVVGAYMASQTISAVTRNTRWLNYDVSGRLSSVTESSAINTGYQP